MNAALIFYIVVVAVILAIGIPLALSLIGGGKGQHKGDPQPFRRRAAGPDRLAQHAAAPVLPTSAAEVPFTAEVEASAALERAALLLPPGFDPDVDSMVNGIQPVRDGAP